MAHQLEYKPGICMPVPDYIGTLAKAGLPANTLKEAFRMARTQTQLEICCMVFRHITRWRTTRTVKDDYLTIWLNTRELLAWNAMLYTYYPAMPAVQAY